MANKIYHAPETAIVWDDSGGADEDIPLNALSDGGVASGSYWDRGSGSQAGLFIVELFIDGFASGVAAGDPVELWIAESDSTTEFTGEPSSAPSNTAGSTSIFTANMLPNLLKVLTAMAVSSTAADEARKREVVEISGRYIVPVVHNLSGQALASNDNHSVTITPWPPEIQ